MMSNAIPFKYQKVNGEKLKHGMYDVWEARPFLLQPGSNYKIFPKKSYKTLGFPVDVNRFHAALRRWETAGRIPRSSRHWHLDKLDGVICKCYDNSLTMKHTLTFPSLQCTSVRLWEKIMVHQTVWIRVDCYQCWQPHPRLPLSTCKHGWGLQWLRWDCDDARSLQVPGERQNATVVAWYLWYFRLVVLIMLQRHLKIGKLGSQVELFLWSTLLLLSLFWCLKAPAAAHLNIWQSETPQIDMSKSCMPTEVIRILDDEAMPLTRAWCLPLGHSKDFETHHLQQGKHWKIHEGITNYMHR